MSLRSKPVKGVHDKLAEAADAGFGLSIHVLQAYLKKRNIFGVIWELRRHGAEVIAVRDGRKIVGWILKSKLPATPIARMDEPTPQMYINFKPNLFAGRSAPPPPPPPAPSPKLPPRNRGKLYNPSRRPLTVAAKRVIRNAA